MKRGVVVLLLVILLSATSIAAGTDQCQLCFTYAPFRERSDTTTPKCVPFGEDLNTDLIHGVGPSTDFTFQIKDCPTEVNNAWKLCKSYTPTGGNSEPFECAPFGQSLTHKFASGIGQGHSFDLKVECTAQDCSKAPLAGSQLWSRYTDNDGRLGQSIGWQKVNFGNTLRIDFEGGVDRTDDFDIHIEPNPPQRDIIIPYASSWFTKFVTTGCSVSCGSPRSDKNGKEWKGPEYDTERDLDETDAPYGTGSCGISEDQIIETRLDNFRKLYARKIFDLDHQKELYLKFGVDNHLTCYLNGQIVIDQFGDQASGICGYSVEFTKTVPATGTVKGANAIACEITDQDGFFNWFDLQVEGKHIDPDQDEADKNENICKVQGGDWAKGTPQGPCCGDDETDRGKVSNSKELKCTMETKNEWQEISPEKNSAECTAAGGFFVSGIGCCGDTPSDNGKFFGSDLCFSAQLIKPSTDPFKIQTFGATDFISNGQQWFTCPISAVTSPSDDTKAQAAKFLCKGSQFVECCDPKATDERKCTNPQRSIIPGQSTTNLNNGFTKTFNSPDQSIDVPLLGSLTKGQIVAISFKVSSNTSILVEFFDSTGKLIQTEKITDFVNGKIAIGTFMVAYVPIKITPSKIKLHFKISQPPSKKVNNILTIARIWLPANELYCSGARFTPGSIDALWLNDLDNEALDDDGEPAGKAACNAAIPFKWTGTQCCGDDGPSDNYQDTDGSCIAGKPLIEGDLSDNNHIILIKNEFFGCGAVSIKEPFTPQSVCSAQGDYFCSILEKEWSQKPSLAGAAPSRTAIKSIPPNTNLLKNPSFEENK